MTARLEDAAGDAETPGLRDPDTVMRLARLGAFHPTRISFARSLIRRMARENWTIERERFDLNSEGVGTAVYRIDTGTIPFRFVAFADHLDPADRTDRVIAEKWDATFTLTSTEATDEEIERLRANIPLQEAGRCSSKELVLSRANKSVRLYEHVVDALAAGRQPERAKLLEVGYLVRTTAVYGNGKFGLADLAQVQAQGVFGLPFQAEMLCVYIARQFSVDWVEHIAQARGGSTFVPLDPRLKRALGVGNATGLGMAPFLVGHPKLIHRWILARETALARVRAVETVSGQTAARFNELLQRAEEHVRQWPTTDALQQRRNAELLKDVPRIREAFDPALTTPWAALTDWASTNVGLEAQEMLNSLTIELYPDLTDDLETRTGTAEEMPLDPMMTLGALRSVLDTNYAWALKTDFSLPSAMARFWYRSEEKEEPRVGWRFEDPGAEKEFRIAVARDVAALVQVLDAQDSDVVEASVAEFLMAFPEWRETVRRVQSLANHPYAEIRDNLIDETCRPIDLLRCKLSIFGAGKFDPKSDLWTRIALFQGAPLAENLSDDDADDWAFPVLPEGVGR